MNKYTTILATALFTAFLGTASAVEPGVKDEVQTLELSGSDSAELGTYAEDNDPIEPVNRAIFGFNEVVDKAVLKPVSRGYKAVVPQWGRDRVTNALYNITEPVTVLNSALQADPENAFTSLWRFLINTTFGLLGTFDAASELGLKPRQEDFGQTLAVWGLNDTPYIVLPFIGPSTVGDTGGMVVDYYTNPFYNGMVTDDDGVRYGLLAARVIDTRTNLLDITDEIDRTSLDKYATYRSAYLQKRRNDINNGKPAE